MRWLLLAVFLLYVGWLIGGVILEEWERGPDE